MNARRCWRVSPDGEKDDLPGIAYRDGDGIRINGGPQAAAFVDAAALSWPDELVRRHLAHHHRFDRAPTGPGAEVEASRGCPYHCSFCAKELFRDRYRRRNLDALLVEIDGLLEQGVEYLYFIDEIFLPNRALLEALVEREVAFGVQTRIDLWKPAMIELLGRAGCVSIEAGVESLTPEGRDALDKDCRIDTAELTERLILAKQHVPFVQANLIETPADDARAIAALARRDAGLWDLGQRPGAPVPLPRLAGLPQALGRAGRSGLGTGPPRTICVSSTTSATSRTTGRGRSPSSRRGRREPPRALPRRVLMTADAVGGVWHYALELARGLTGSDVEVVLAVLGPPPAPEQELAAAAIDGLTLVHGGFALEWMPGAERDLDAAGTWLLELEEAFAPDLIHLNGFAHATLPWRVPTVVVAHSCVLSWWRAVHGVDAPAEWAELSQAHACGTARGRPRGGADARIPGAGAGALWPPGAHAVDLERLRAVRADGHAKEPLIFAAGRVWDKGKNLQALAAIAHRLAWPLAIAGAGAPRARRAARHAPWLGPLSTAAMRRWYARAAAFVLPARYEPFGLAALEAAMARLRARARRHPDAARAVGRRRLVRAAGRFARSSSRR